MKQSDKRAALLPLVALLLWCLGTFWAQRAADLTDSVSARWPSDGVNPAQLTKYEEYAREDGAQSLPAITLWTERTDQTLSDGTERTVSAAVIELFGNCEDICSAELLTGGFPARTDPKGCAISEATAFGLWGSRDILGKTVFLDDEAYQVRGVFRGGTGLMLLQRDATSTANLPNMQLRFADGNALAAAEAFLLRAGFRGAQLLDLPLLGRVIGTLAWLPAIVLGAHTLLRLLRRGLQLRCYPVLLISYALSAGLVAVACLLLLGFPWNIPDQLIPTKWSDFEFWGHLFGDLANSIRAWLTIIPTSRDLAFWSRTLIAAFLALESITLSALSLSKVSVRTGRGLMAGCLSSMGAILLAALLLAPHGGLYISRNMWLIPWVWLSVDYGLWLHAKQLRLTTAKEVEYATEDKDPQYHQVDITETNSVSFGTNNQARY